jgi:hypothetical protein
MKLLLLIIIQFVLVVSATAQKKVRNKHLFFLELAKEYSPTCYEIISRIDNNKIGSVKKSVSEYP